MGRLSGRSAAAGPLLAAAALLLSIVAAGKAQAGPADCLYRADKRGHYVFIGNRCGRTVTFRFSTPYGNCQRKYFGHYPCASQVGPGGVVLTSAAHNDGKMQVAACFYDDYVSNACKLY
jgi:hypothetical protein